MDEARAGPPGRRIDGQVDLRGIARDHHTRSKAHAGQEHLHLFVGGVLGFVQDDEGIIEQPVLLWVKRLLS